MSRARRHYVCQKCGFESAGWLGKCPDCGAWNSMAEEAIEAPGGSRRRTHGLPGSLSEPVPLTAPPTWESERFETGIVEFDRVLGGGVVPGSLILVGGEPGIGKSTLMLQAAERLSTKLAPVLYVAGEESFDQVRLRAERLGVNTDAVLVLNETRLESIRGQVEKLAPQALIVDSIQAVYISELPSAPGSLTQVRETAVHLMHLAKSREIPIFVVGHVTKEGLIAGPRALEHIVDTVLYFEGEGSRNYRILRAVKNRFGSTNELGIFEMTTSGLRDLPDASGVFLSERPQGVPGSAVAACVEGTRPLLVEIQALVTPSSLTLPRRMATGFNANRLAMLLAVLEKRAGRSLSGHDVFVNVAGGARVTEPATDLATAAAVASSLDDVPVRSDTVAVGEVGLAGEVRSVPHIDRRMAEAAKLGFRRCVVASTYTKDGGDLEVVGVRTVAEALERILAR